MSQRASFTTEYIYCWKCYEAAKTVLCDTVKHLCAGPTVRWTESDIADAEIPIIAGKIGGLYGGEERAIFNELCDELAPKLCHQMRLVLLPEADDEGPVFRVLKPANK